MNVLASLRAFFQSNAYPAALVLVARRAVGHGRVPVSKTYVITRARRGEIVNDRELTGRCYVTGPHFGSDVFSSTDDPDTATRYTKEEAEHIIAARRSWVDPRIESAPQPARSAEREDRP